MVGGLRRPIVAIIRVCTDRWFPGYFGRCVSGRMQGNIKSCSTDDPVQLSATLIGFYSMRGGVGRPVVAIIRVSWINRFPAISAISSLVRQGKMKTYSKGDPGQSNGSPLALGHFDRMLACVRWCETAQDGDKAIMRVFTDQFGLGTQGSTVGVGQTASEPLRTNTTY